MENFEKERLVNMVLAPYIQKATALRGIRRYVGGNQFRHALGTFAILIDYHYVDPVLLKASVIHDLFEDAKCTSFDEIRSLDEDGREVLALVMEETRKKTESKDDYLKRMLTEGSERAKILKCADRISNVTDLHFGIFKTEKMNRYLDETEKYIVPIAAEVNHNMFVELTDLISKRRKMLQKIEEMELCTGKFLN